MRCAGLLKFQTEVAKRRDASLRFPYNSWHSTTDLIDSPLFIKSNGLDQPGDTGRQHTRFSGAGARENQGALMRQGDGGESFGIEVVKEILHP